jgi:hypothetical protein
MLKTISPRAREMLRLRIEDDMAGGGESDCARAAGRLTAAARADLANSRCTA